MYYFNPKRDETNILGKKYSLEKYKTLSTDERHALKEEAIDRFVDYTQNGPVKRLKNGKRARPPETDGDICWPYEIDQIFGLWEKQVETPEEKLEQLLKRHDWYYEYSDDHRAWAKGGNQRSTIMSLVSSLGVVGQELYNQYCPFNKE